VKKQLRRNKTTHKNELKETSGTSIFKSILFWLPYSGALSILLGFGYMTGLAAQFGYSATDILVDTKGFLFAGLYPIFTIFVEIFSWDYFKDFVISSVSDNSVYLYILISLLAYFLFNLCFRTPKKQTRTRNLIRSSLPKIFVREPSSSRVIVETLLVAALSVTYKLIITLLLYGVLIAITSMLILAFGLGYKEGAKYAQEEIIKPKNCAPYIKKTGKDIEKTAYCSRIIQDDNEVARGRLIAFNSERIFLYVREAKTGDDGVERDVRIPKSFPIRNAIIERVDTEDVR